MWSIDVANRREMKVLIIFLNIGYISLESCWCSRNETICKIQNVTVLSIRKTIERVTKYEQNNEFEHQVTEQAIPAFLKRKHGAKCLSLDVINRSTFMYQWLYKQSNCVMCYNKEHHGNKMTTSVRCFCSHHTISAGVSDSSLKSTDKCSGTSIEELLQCLCKIKTDCFEKHAIIKMNINRLPLEIVLICFFILVLLSCMIVCYIEEYETRYRVET